MMLQQHKALSLVWLLCTLCLKSKLIGSVLLNNEKFSVQELNSLWDFFNSTKGNDWYWSQNDTFWNFSSINPNPCLDGWKGLSCVESNTNNISHLNIVGISLRNFGLNGFIPQSISNLTQIQSLDLNTNYLAGQFPNFIVNMTTFQQLDLGGCFLTGTIPSGLIHFQHLELLNLGENNLEGAIPPFGMFFPHLAYLDLFQNDLTGTLPESISNLVNITYMYINHNSLTGTVPNSWNLLPKMDDVSFWVNSLTGSVPLFTGSGQTLTFLGCGFNHFSGTVSNIIGTYSTLSTIYLDHNVLSGSLPNLSGTAGLKILSMFSNLFTGSLNHVFNATTQSNLHVIELTDNQFGGQLPTSLFSVPSLQAISLGRNCLHGSIPLSVCGLSHLSTLSLDGLMTASSCQQKFFPRSFDIYTYRTKRQVSGGIPSCLLEMPNLFSLHMSANGIEGQIFQKGNTTLGSNLIDLSLSFNSLTGEIPTAIQQREWKILDLSNNRLSGTLSRFSAFNNPNQTLSLQVNRISGVVPDNLMSASNIQILEGNMFSCPFGNKELPEHDSYLHKYSCSSQSFNYATYIWCFAFIVFVCVIVCAAWHVRKSVTTQSTNQYQDKEDRVKENESDTTELVQNGSLLHQAYIKSIQWLSVFKDKAQESDLSPGSIETRIESYKRDHPAFDNFMSVIDVNQRGSVYMLVYVLCVALPVYVALTHYYGTYTQEYAWILSAVYLTGTNACIMITLVVFGAVAITIRLHHHHKTVTIKPSMQSVSSKLRLESVSFWLVYVCLCFIVLFDMVVVLTVNIAYIYALTSQSREVIFALQVLVALFKILWNSTVIPSLMRWLYVVLDAVLRDGSASASDTKFVKRLTVELFLVLFNNLAASFISSALFNHNCFYGVLVPSQNQAQLSCLDYAHETAGFECIAYEQSDSSFKSYHPPFTYNYQCSSAVITSFANIYVYMFLFNTFLDPLFILALKTLHNKYHSDHKDSRVFWILKHILPRLLRPTDDLLASYSKTVQVNDTPLTAQRALSLLFFPEVDRNSLFDGHQFAVNMLQIFSIIMTFGVVVPPLAVCGCFALWSKTVYFQLLVGRFIYMCSEKCEHQKELRQLLEILAGDMGRLSTTITASEWVALPFIFVFYALLLFDTLGDQIGWRRALYLPVVVCGVPIVFRVCVVLSSRFCPNESGRLHKKTIARALNFSVSDDGNL